MEETNSATPAPIEENRSQKAVESNQLGLKAVALYSYDKQDEDEVLICSLHFVKITVKRD